MKRPFAGDHLVEDGAKAEYVGARIHRHAAHLLRRHVSRSAQYHARLGRVCHGGQRSMIARLRLSQFGQTEVENFYAPIFGDENIFWLQVAMDNSFFVRRSQPMRDLQRVIESLAYCYRSTTQTIP